MTPPAAVWPFTLSALYVGDRVDLRVGGSLDTTTAPLLRSSMKRLADDGHLPLTLDLAELDMMDAAGARAVANVAAHIAGLGARLVVRDASPKVRTTIHLGGWDSLIDFIHADRLEPVSDDTVPGSPATKVAAAPFVRRSRGDRPVDIDEALRLVTSLAHAAVDGADGVSVSLRRRGAFTTVAASDDRIAQMDRDQYATGEGPCLTAAAEDRTVEVARVEAEARWPDFVPLARVAGIASILSSPLHSSAGPVGALNMYSKSSGAFGARQRVLARLFADHASGLLALVHDRAGGDVGQRLQAALHVRTAITLAQGILMARTGASAEDAYASLRLSARETSQTILEVAEATVRTTEPGATHV